MSYNQVAECHSTFVYAPDLIDYAEAGELLIAYASTFLLRRSFVNLRSSL